MGVILLRAIAFLICAFLVSTTFCQLMDQSVLPGDRQTIDGKVTPPKPELYNESAPKNESSGNTPLWQGLLQLLPDKAIENANIVWQHGKANQLAVVSAGLLTCLTAILLAGPARLRRIDAVASVLWLIILCLYLAETYLTDASGCLDTAKYSTIALCCLVSFAAAVATRKPMGPQRGRCRRSETEH